MKVARPLLEGTVALAVAYGSATDFEGNAMVNAANEKCLGGSSLDYVVNSGGGSVLQNARKKLPLLNLNPEIRCYTGQAVITVGVLEAVWCIHVVGPDFREPKYQNMNAFRLLENIHGAI